MEIFIKIGETTFHSLDREEEPCMKEPAKSYSYSEVQFKKPFSYAKKI